MTDWNEGAVRLYQRLGFRIEKSQDDSDKRVRKLLMVVNYMPESSLRIRPARVDDAAALCTAEHVIAQTPGLLISRPEELRPEAFAALIEKLADGAGCYFVAEENGSSVGHALLNPMDLAALAHVFRLTIVVHPGQNGRGIGTALMRAVCNWATRSARVHKVELLVRSTNERALRLYRKFGFAEEGRLRERVRLPDDSFVDEISMAWFPRRRDKNDR